MYKKKYLYLLSFKFKYQLNSDSIQIHYIKYFIWNNNCHSYYCLIIEKQEIVILCTVVYQFFYQFIIL